MNRKQNKQVEKLIRQQVRRIQKTNPTLWLVVAVLVVALTIIQSFNQGNLPDVLSSQAIQDIIKPNQLLNLNELPRQVRIPVEVSRIIDGDTIIVDIEGHETRVRYLMVDTPEVNHSDPNLSDLWGNEAKEVNQNLLHNSQQVYVELDVGPATDNYSRLLAYVYADDVLVNERLIQEGLATVRYVNPPNNSYEGMLIQAENQAKQDGKGLWQ